MPGLDGGRAIEFQHVRRAEGRPARGIIGQHVVHEVGQARVDDRHGGGGIVLPQYFAFAVFDAQHRHRIERAIAGALAIFRNRCASHVAVVGEDAEGIHHVEQLDFAAAQGQRQAVITQPLIERGDAHLVRGADDVANAGHLQRAHGWDVVGTSQGETHPRVAVILAVVILRHIDRRIRAGLRELGAHIKEAVRSRHALR